MNNFLGQPGTGVLEQWGAEALLPALWIGPFHYHSLPFRPFPVWPFYQAQGDEKLTNWYFILAVCSLAIAAYDVSMDR